MPRLAFADSLKNKLILNFWLSIVRVLYTGVIFFGIYFGGVQVGVVPEFFSLVPSIIIGLVILGLIVTFVIYAISQSESQFRQVNSLSYFQLMTDFAVIYLIYHLLTSSQSGFFILYFIPLIYSIILFRFWMPIILSALSVLFISNFFLVPIPEHIYLIVSVYAIGGVVITVIAYMVDAQRRTSFMQTQELKKATDEIREMQRKHSAQEFELETVENRLAHLDQAKSDFITLTTHELRTPLSAINWALDILKTEGDPEVRSETIDKALQSVHRMNKLIDRIITISKDTEEDTPYEFSSVETTSLLHEVLSELAGVAARKNIHLSADIKNAPKIEADLDKLRVAIEEIVSNAITYTPKGGKVHVGVNTNKLNSARSSVDIVVSDNGIGIPDEDKDKVFDRFYRSREAQLTETDGTGLGLYIVHEIVKRHSGTIWYEDNPGGGTRFHVELPVSQN